MDYYKKILSENLFKGSQNSNFQLNTFFSQDNRPLPLGDQEVAVNEYDQFVKERNKSTCFRLSGTLNGLFSNVLFNVTGDLSYETILSLSANTGLNNPNIQIFQNFGFKDILLETDGWFYYLNPVGACNPKCIQEFLRPVPNDFYYLPLPVSGITNLNSNGDPIQNWHFKITYPAYSGCGTMYFQSPYILGLPGRVTICDGLAVQNIATGIINGRSATYIETPIKHGLIVGDQIIMRPFTVAIPEQVFNVVEVENDTRFWIDYWDNNIPLNIISNSVGLNDPLRIKRIHQGIESKYMIRRFKSITDLNEYQLYRAGFARNIFNDPIQLYHFQLDIDTSPYRDYLNRPLTELYLTKIKFNNYGGSTQVPTMEPWTLLSVGTLTNFPNLNYDINAIYGGSPSRPSVIPPKVIEFVTEADDDFFGDIVDYNENTITERVLTDAYYRFNTQNREDNGYGEGYYYKAHDKIQILEFSSQVEQENLTLPDVDIPNYAVTVDGIIKWRDLLSPGFIDAAGVGVDYPFLNGCTYIHTDHNLCLKRQNPTQNLIYSASVTTYAPLSTPLPVYDFSHNISPYNILIQGQQNQVTDKYFTNVTFNTVVISSTQFNNIKFTAPVDGIYPFNCTLNFDLLNNLPTGVNGEINIYLTHRLSTGEIITRYLIGTIPQSILSVGSATPITFVRDKVLTMNQNETVTVEIYYTLGSNLNSGPFTLRFIISGNLNSIDQITGNPNSNTIISQQYWLSGINCEKQYGEYIEAVDGEC